MPALTTSISSPPNARTPSSRAPRIASSCGDVADHPPELRALVQAAPDAPGFMSSPTTARAPAQERLDTGASDPGRGARHQGHLAGKDGRRATPAELRLFQVPVLDLEDVSCRKGLPPAERRGPQYDIDRVPVDLGRDRSLTGRGSGGEQAPFRIQDHARGRIEEGGPRVRGRGASLEIGFVIAAVSLEVAPDQGNALRAQGVVRRGRTLLRERGDIGALREPEAAGVTRKHDDRRPAHRRRKLAPKPGELRAEGR